MIVLVVEQSSYQTVGVWCLFVLNLGGDYELEGRWSLSRDWSSVPPVCGRYCLLGVFCLVFGRVSIVSGLVGLAVFFGRL